MEETCGIIDTSVTPSQNSGTVSHVLITAQSIITLTMERNFGEDIDISSMSPKVVGPPSPGSFNWELTPFIGHDNPVRIHYIVKTP